MTKNINIFFNSLDVIEKNWVDIRNQGTLFTLGSIHLFLWQKKLNFVKWKS